MAVAGDDKERAPPFPEEEEQQQTAAAKIAVLTVLKKGSILKNIFLNCPPRPSSIQGAEEEGCGRGVADEDEDKASILIGRHPDCHIVLDHPSISRFHLELRLSLSEQKLSVVDRSSVHGTWVSGTKIPPNVAVNLVDGDSLRLGASTRVYRLQWVSPNRAFEMENPLAPLPEEDAYQDDSSYVTADSSELRDSKIPQEPLADEKNVQIFQDHAGHKEIGDINAQSNLEEVPSAPSMMEFMSPASKKIVEESAISSLVAPMLECFSSLFPSVVENMTCVPASSVNEEQSHRERLSPPRSEKSMPSSLLYRRSKSKSVSSLRIQTGRNKGEAKNNTADIESEEITAEVINTFTKQLEIQETLYRAPTEKLDAREEFKEVLDVHEENVALMSPIQKMKSTLLGQKSLDAVLIMEEDQSCVIPQQKSISVSCLGTQTGKSKETSGNIVADNGVEEGIRKENCGVCEQVEQEGDCRVLFDSLSGKEEEKHLFDSDKENITPISLHQNMKKNTILQQKSLDATLSAEEHLSRALQQKSRSNHRLRIQSGSKGRIENTMADKSEGVCCRMLFDGLGVQEEDKEVFDSDKENVTPMSACQKMNKSYKTLQKSVAATLNVEEDMSSTLQQKSRSANCLRTQSGRSKKRIENTAADGGIKEGTRKENFTFCEQVESEKMLCKVIFDISGGQEEDKRLFNSDKENVIPILARQNKKNKALCRHNSFAANLSMEEEFYASRHMDLSSKEEEILTLDKESGVDSCHKSKNSNVALHESFTFSLGECMNNLEKGKWTPEILRSINIDEGCSASDLETMAPGSELILKEDHIELPQSNNAFNVAKNLSYLAKDNYSLKFADVNEVTLSPEFNMKVEENGCSPGKENQTSRASRSMKTKDLSDANIGELSSELTVKIEDDKENGFSSDKENQTPQASKSVKMKGPLSETSDNISLKFADVNEVTLSPEFNMKVEENGCSPGKENQTSRASRSMKTKDLSDANIGELSSELTMKIEDDKENGFSSDKENQTPQASKSVKMKGPLSETSDKIQREITKKRMDRIPFQSLLETSASRTQNNIIHSNSTSCSYAQKYETSNYYSNQSTTAVPRITGQEKKIWNIVVDTDCLLDEESRRALQLLEGMKATHLIVPRIAIRELDNLKRHESFFRKSTRASSVLQWIEDCMENISWWIHVQSSFETVPVQPTPPVSPQAPNSNGINDDVSKSLSFSTHGSFVDIVSPTAEDHILDCALLFKKIKNDGHLVLLSNSTTLKIKAMAEGLLCETAKEFRESLVNPFSRRFLWVDSSPRGPTWSCNTEVGLFDNYYCHRPPVRKSVKVAEPARGLKLILLHNSQYGQFNSVK